VTVHRLRKIGIITGLCLVALTLSTALYFRFGQASQFETTNTITGQLVDSQGQPIQEATITATLPDQGEAQAEAESQEDGSWTLELAEVPENELLIEIERSHFNAQSVILEREALEELSTSGVYSLGTMAMERRITIGFWIATLVFVVILLLIAFEALHSTTAALAGASIIFLVSYIGGAFHPDLFIFGFDRGINYINWEVIFLVMGMMIIIAIVEGTGVFQWTAFQAYRLSRGRSWLLVLILMGVTGVASALLDNFTTMLLMTPISMQIGLALGINPLALIIPEILASNVAGITTLIGTPTNILIGAFAGIGFNDFLINQTIGVLVALAAMAGYVLFHFRHEYKQSGGISPKLYETLEENAQIESRQALWKSGLVFLLVLAGFVVGESVHLVPAVPALAGATLLLIWLNPNIHQMIKAVDWTTLVFFMALFIVVGGIQEVGLISLIAQGMSQMVGENLNLAIFVIVFGVGTASTAIANIPLTASMLPIVQFLSGTIPAANNNVLYYALSMGAAMGGNGFLIGGEANLVTAGITEQTDSPITFMEFLKVGLPVTYITLTFGFLWLIIRF
jgi:Na+/H+ antiporter NhaD/arsenite permease-like protein